MLEMCTAFSGASIHSFPRLMYPREEFLQSLQTVHQQRYCRSVCAGKSGNIHKIILESHVRTSFEAVFDYGQFALVKRHSCMCAV